MTYKLKTKIKGYNEYYQGDKRNIKNKKIKIKGTYWGKPTKTFNDIIG